MSDAYIRRSATIDLIRRHIGSLHTSREESLLVWVIGTLQTMPAADVAPAVHGRWNISKGALGDMCKCSACGSLSSLPTRFYPHCGARMDGGDGHAAD